MRPVASRAATRYRRMRDPARSAIAMTTTNGANTNKVIRESVSTSTMTAMTANSADPTMSAVHATASSVCSMSSRNRVIISPGDSFTAWAPGSS